MDLNSISYSEIPTSGINYSKTLTLVPDVQTSKQQMIFSLASTPLSKRYFNNSGTVDNNKIDILNVCNISSPNTTQSISSDNGLYLPQHEQQISTTKALPSTGSAFSAPIGISIKQYNQNSSQNSAHETIIKTNFCKPSTETSNNTNSNDKLISNYNELECDFF